MPNSRMDEQFGSVRTQNANGEKGKRTQSCGGQIGSSSTSVLARRRLGSARTRKRSRSKLARPYMVRFIILSRLTWPSVRPLFQGVERPSRMDDASRWSEVAKD